MAINVANLSNSDLLDMWFDLCGEKVDISNKESIMFSLDQNDVVYVEKKENKWVDVTHSGVEGKMSIINDGKNLRILNNETTTH